MDIYERVSILQNNVCSECGEAFDSSKELDKHIRLKHPSLAKE